jgi:DNA-3-methyladenine glycosylase II
MSGVRWFQYIREEDQHMQRDPVSAPITPFQLETRGPFSLEAAARFLNGFPPLTGTHSASNGHVHLAFSVDGSDVTVGACLQADGDALNGEIVGDADAAVVRKQVARIFSLDVDGTGFSDVAQRDPVVGELQARYPGLRPICFYSPYEAGAWALLSQRVQMTQAARIKARMAEELGETIEIHGDRVHAFPAPARLLELEAFRGLFGRKVEYLHGLAHAALEGRLDADRLRSLPTEEALSELMRLPGVGEFSSRLILLRGAATPDGPPAREPRLMRAVTMAYGLEELPADAELERLIDGWRPYRTWAAFLLRAMLQDQI